MYFILRCVILFNMGHICKICKKYGQLFTTRSFTDSTMYPQQPTPAEFRPLLNLRETIMHIQYVGNNTLYTKTRKTIQGRKLCAEIGR